MPALALQLKALVLAFCPGLASVHPSGHSTGLLVAAAVDEVLAAVGVEGRAVVGVAVTVARGIVAVTDAALGAAATVSIACVRLPRHLSVEPAVVGSISTLYCPGLS